MFLHEFDLTAVWAHTAHTPAGNVTTWACSGARFDCVSLLTLAVVWAVRVLTEARLTKLRVQTTLVNVYSIQQRAHRHVTCWLANTTSSHQSTLLHCTTVQSVVLLKSLLLSMYSSSGAFILSVMACHSLKRTQALCMSENLTACLQFQSSWRTLEGSFSAWLD